ncbi:MAG: phosphoribosylamine--glycine ligase [Candidatus Porifericomitaceae bacterium WSBS_2022_MAG_OTU9]
MRVAVIGSGGREHAIVWHCARQAGVTKVFAIPGNPGAAMEPGVECVRVDINDHGRLVRELRGLAVDLVLIGPEAPLAAGLMDVCSDAGLLCLGPSRAAAVLEASKHSMKEFCRRHGIATAKWQSFTVLDDALAYLQSVQLPVVVKADGLAAGKGVVVAQEREVAMAVAKSMLSGERHGEAGSRIVIEDFIQGQEASFTVLTDGTNIVQLATAQDHKARDDGGLGPNTGGMGAYSPTPLMTEQICAKVMASIIRPAVRGMAQEGIQYQGFLYAGLMVSPDGEPKLLEFNCRLGDPETQVILPRLQEDLALLCYQAASSSLQERQLNWSSQCSLGVVLAAPGYPDQPRTGEPISGITDIKAEDLFIFHAGTKKTSGGLVTAGGRVMCIAALSDDISSARSKAYQAAAEIHWPDMVLRRDIAYRAM